MTKEEHCKYIIDRLCVQDCCPRPKPVQKVESQTVKANKPQQEEYPYETRKYSLVRIMPPEVHIRLSRIHGMKLIKRNGSEFHVQGTTDEYVVKIGTTPSCDCPDDATICKHILFVYLNVLKVPKTSYIIYQEALLKREWDGILKGNIPSNDGGEMDDETGEFVSYDPQDNYQEALMTMGKRKNYGGFSSSKKRR